MNRLISAIRILYTVVLLLFGLEIVTLMLVNDSMSKSGKVPSVLLITAVGLFLLLLVSRLLHSRSPKWLWLGVPTTLVIIAFGTYLLLFPAF